MSGSSGSSKVWLVFLLVPFFAAVGHDIYMSRTLNPDHPLRLETFDIDPEAYQASDFGYILVKYTPAVYDTAKSVMGDDTWAVWVDPILRLYTFIVALVPAALYLLWLIVSWAVDGVGSLFRGRISTSKNYSKAGDTDYAMRRALGDNETHSFKYKRR